MTDIKKGSIISMSVGTGIIFIGGSLIKTGIVLSSSKYYIISAFYIWGLSAIIIGLPIVIISIIIYVRNN